MTKNASVATVQIGKVSKACKLSKEKERKGEKLQESDSAHDVAACVLARICAGEVARLFWGRGGGGPLFHLPKKTHNLNLPSGSFHFFLVNKIGKQSQRRHSAHRLPSSFFSSPSFPRQLAIFYLSTSQTCDSACFWMRVSRQAIILSNDTASMPVCWEEKKSLSEDKANNDC